MRQLLRNHRLYFILLTLAGLSLRLLFVLRFQLLTDDGFLYGDIAKNWLTRGVYGVGPNALPTLIRLPGYPAALAMIWSVFGLENYGAVLGVQVVADLLTCFLVADMAHRMFAGCADGSGIAGVAGNATVAGSIARFAFAITALCPFLANYTAVPLTETFAIFFAALALDLALAGLNCTAVGQPRLLVWAGCGLALAGGILLRPDGGILLGAMGLYLLWRLLRDRSRRLPLFLAALTMSVTALAPLVPWTLRNYRVFGVIQPLAPRYANAPGEFVPVGFDRWIKTWLADYVSVEEIYWNEGDAAIDIHLMPERAFDSAEEYQKVADLLQAYNVEKVVTPELDAQFAKLAEVRIQRNPLRYYVWLPMVRSADMWLRPRTELLGIESRWWDWENDPEDSSRAIALGALNLVLMVAGLAGVWLSLLRQIRIRWLGLALLFVGLRSAFLGTIENPEPRYMLECFPVVICLAAVALSWGAARLPARPRWLSARFLRSRDGL